MGDCARRRNRSRVGNSTVRAVQSLCTVFSDKGTGPNQYQEPDFQNEAIRNESSPAHLPVSLSSPSLPVVDLTLECCFLDFVELSVIEQRKGLVGITPAANVSSLRITEARDPLFARAIILLLNSPDCCTLSRNYLTPFTPVDTFKVTK